MARISSFLASHFWSHGAKVAQYNISFTYFCSSIGWRLGLQAVTGVVFLTFFLGTFYRSASLYHPQRRAILHLKSQKRKIKNKDKEKNKAQDDRPPYFDFTTLRSRTIQILLLSIFVSSFGMNAPLFYLVRECYTNGTIRQRNNHNLFDLCGRFIMQAYVSFSLFIHFLQAQQAFSGGVRGTSLLLLQAFLGMAWALGCCLFGAIVATHSKECKISRQYLCQVTEIE